MRNEHLDRQLESRDNVNTNIRKLLEFPLSAIANSTKDLIEFQKQLKNCYTQFIENSHSAIYTLCKNGTVCEASEIEKEKEHITKKNVNSALARARLIYKNQAV